MKYLITGGAGFVGSNLAHKLAEDPNNSLVIVDNLSTGNASYLPVDSAAHCTFIQGDVNDRSFLGQLFKDYTFDFVFHYAATVGVKRTLDHPMQVLSDIDGFKNLFGLSAEHGVKRVFFSSSSEVYGVSKEFPQNELTTPLNARLPYAIVKSVGESYLESLHKESGLEYTIFRFFNTYGPRQSTDYVLSRFIKAALCDEPITVYGDGSQTRTFCFVQDNITACLTALSQNKIVNDVVNIGSDIEISIKELAEIIIRVTNSKSQIQFLPALTEGDMPRRRPDIAKMRSELIAHAFTPIEDGIRLTADYFRSQLS